MADWQRMMISDGLGIRKYCTKKFHLISLSRFVHSALPKPESHVSGFTRSITNYDDDTDLSLAKKKYAWL